jgi:hypothetical protein
VKRISILLMAILLAAVAAGCSSQSGQSASAEPTATPEPTPEPTPSDAASSEGGLPSFAPGAGDLARFLPTEVGGLTLNYQSASGEDVLGSADLTPEIQAFFDRVDATPADLSSAIGIAFDMENESGISIFAFRVAGTDSATLRDEFISTMEDQGETLGEETTVAGKQVTAMGQDGGSGYLYVKDDVIYIVGGEPASLVEEALSQLP